MKAPLIVVACLVVSSVAASANSRHKAERTLYIHSETVLSGIDVYRDRSERAIEKLGVPSRERIVPATSAWPGWRIYEWELTSCFVRVVTEDWEPRKGAIQSIDVVGVCKNPKAGVTGRGLKIGATLENARQIYSPFGQTISESDIRAMPFLGGYEPILQVDFDKAGKVHHMKLTNQCVPFCY